MSRKAKFRCGPGKMHPRMLRKGEEMGGTVAIAAPKSRDWPPRYKGCEPALQAFFGGNAEYTPEYERIGCKQVIDMPARPRYTYSCTADVPCHPRKPAGPKRGTDVDMESPGELDRSERTHLFSTGSVLQDQAVYAAMHR